MSQRKDVRAYYWTSVAYPESLPDGWLMYLRNTHVQFIVSPLHDADLNADETEKKAHYHLLFCFESLKSFSQVKDLFCDPIHATIPQVCLSVRGLVRYFAHLDNPEKHQYDVADIQAFNGACVEDLLKRTVTEKHRILRDIIQFIEQNDIREFCDLIYILSLDKDPLWFDVLCESYTLVLSQYIGSRRNKLKSNIPLIKKKVGNKNEVS